MKKENGNYYDGRYNERNYGKSVYVTTIIMCDSEENVMSKGLEALEKVGETFGIKKMSVYKDIEKELKALEIIKRFIDINFFFANYELTQEEYNLLKEVLECQDKD